MWKDTIVEDVRKVREEHAAKFNFSRCNISRLKKTGKEKREKNPVLGKEAHGRCRKIISQVGQNGYSCPMAFKRCWAVKRSSTYAANRELQHYRVLSNPSCQSLHISE